MSTRDIDDAICPICGFYCLGNGGHGCIDKPGMIEKSEPANMPKPYPELMADCASVHHSQLGPEPRSERIILLIPPALKTQLDKLCKQESLSRNEAVNRALDAYFLKSIDAK